MMQRERIVLEVLVVERAAKRAENTVKSTSWETEEKRERRGIKTVAVCGLRQILPVVLICGLYMPVSFDTAFLPLSCSTTTTSSIHANYRHTSNHVLERMMLLGKSKRERTREKNVVACNGCCCWVSSSKSSLMGTHAMAIALALAANCSVSLSFSPLEVRNPSPLVGFI